MKRIKHMLLAITLMFCGSLIAQTFAGDEEQSSTAQESQYLNNQFNVNTVITTPVNVSTNKVFIRQIGNRNLSDITVSSNNAISSINQVGNNNKSYIDLNTSELATVVLQLGNNNRIAHQNYFRENSIINTIEQQGNNQNLEISGSNSLLENMQIQMRGDSQSIIIRSFK